MNIAGKRIKYVADYRKIKRKKTKIYDKEVLTVLKELWKIFDYICSKRLTPFLEEIIPVNLLMTTYFVIVRKNRLPLPEADPTGRMIPVLWNKRTIRSSEGQ